MEKDIESKIKELNDIVIAAACWEEGCKALFGTDLMTDAKALDAIRAKGADVLISKATWSFTVSTKDGFDAWLKNKLKADGLPEYVSTSAFVSVFKHQLTALFQRDQADEKANSKAAD